MKPGDRVRIIEGEHTPEIAVGKTGQLVASLGDIPCPCCGDVISRAWEVELDDMPAAARAAGIRGAIVPAVAMELVVMQ